AFVRDDIDGFLRGGRVAIDAKHLRALARKGDGGRLAIAPTGTDRSRTHHHPCLALEPFHRLLLPVSSRFLVARIITTDCCRRSWSSHWPRSGGQKYPTMFGSFHHGTAAIRRQPRNCRARLPARLSVSAAIETSH